jgi:hypothetical protein
MYRMGAIIYLNVVENTGEKLTPWSTNTKTCDTESDGIGSGDEDKSE